MRLIPGALNCLLSEPHHLQVVAAHAWARTRWLRIVPENVTIFGGGSRTETYTYGLALERTGRIAGVGAGWRLSESRAQGRRRLTGGLLGGIREEGFTPVQRRKEWWMRQGLNL